MALVKCKECQKEVSTKAESCPHCGAKIPKGSGFGTVILVIIGVMAGIGVLSSLLVGGSPPTSTTSNKESPSKEPTAAAESFIKDSPLKSWQYSHHEDPMSKGISHEALRISTNTVEFSFPYQGPQFGSLILRTHPRYGKDVIFQIERGQILCRSYEDCTVEIRFDDRPTSSFSAIGPSDNSSNTIFIQNYNRFVEKMMKSKRIRLSVGIYQNSNPVWEFDVSGFDKSKYLDKK